ncbi:unnamed protein product [Merluccius merluccius]
MFLDTQLTHPDGATVSGVPSVRRAECCPFPSAASVETLGSVSRVEPPPPPFLVRPLRCHHYRDTDCMPV